MDHVIISMTNQVERSKGLPFNDNDCVNGD